MLGGPAPLQPPGIYRFFPAEMQVNSHKNKGDGPVRRRPRLAFKKGNLRKVAHLRTLVGCSGCIPAEPYPIPQSSLNMARVDEAVNARFLTIPAC